MPCRNGGTVPGTRPFSQQERARKRRSSGRTARGTIRRWRKIAVVKQVRRADHGTVDWIALDSASRALSRSSFGARALWER
jgi:hypothetical protein